MARARASGTPWSSGPWVPCWPRAGPAGRPRLLALSARGPEALEELAAAWRDHLRSAPADFADLAYTAGARRTHLEHRLAIVARGAEEAAEKIDAGLRGEQPEL